MTDNMEKIPAPETKAGAVPAIEVRGLSIGYGSRVVLENLNFRIEPGQIVTILGGSGCGKSTLLKHIIGLYKPLHGDILLTGRSIVTANEQEKRSIMSEFGVAYQGGALFRSAAALGVDAVILSPSCTSPLARRAIRVSIGNTFRLPWAQAEPDAWPHATIDALHGAGFACYALALKDDAVSLDDPSLKVPEKRALFFGNEGSGLSRAVLDACDAHVIIPMARGVDSLNVAASSAVAFWELFARDRALNERGPLA